MTSPPSYPSRTRPSPTSRRGRRERNRGATSPSRPCRLTTVAGGLRLKRSSPGPQTPSSRRTSRGSFKTSSTCRLFAPSRPQRRLRLRKSPGGRTSTAPTRPSCTSSRNNLVRATTPGGVFAMSSTPTCRRGRPRLSLTATTFTRWVARVLDRTRAGAHLGASYSRPHRLRRSRRPTTRSRTRTRTGVSPGRGSTPTAAAPTKARRGGST
mmetsp:Transcript_13462/g.27533  ORF Transcript_13462/g.27533 Transcript_13462/m.27533 type:complete len:210 (+) Transcript_13462:1600-2229(+)